jgi:cytochrome P450
MITTRSATSIPSVTLPEAYWLDRGAYLASLYAAHGPIVRSRLGQVEVVFLLGPEANRFVLQTHRQAFSYEHGWGWVFGRAIEPRNLLTMDGAEHRWHRALLHPAFAARRMERYLPLLTRIIDRCLASWATRGVVDVYEEARVITLDVVAEALLGLRPGPEVHLCRAVFLHGAHRRGGEFAALLRGKIAERRAQATDDGLGLLAQARDEQGRPLSDEQLLAHADTLLIAGHETTASLGAWALYSMAKHPDYANRVRDEQARLAPDGQITSAAIENAQALARALSETERLYPPIPTAPRGLLEDVEFLGHLLPAGAKVLYSAAATHLLPTIWTEPMSFDPDRFAPPREEHKKAPYALVGFGGGPRVCIGRTLARLELALLLAGAVSRYQLTIVPGQRIAQRYGVTNRPLHGIRLGVQPQEERGG